MNKMVLNTLSTCSKSPATQKLVLSFFIGPSEHLFLNIPSVRSVLFLYQVLKIEACLIINKKGWKLAFYRADKGYSG